MTTVRKGWAALLFGWVIVPLGADAGSEREVPVRSRVDAATDRPASPSTACAPSGSRCGRVDGDVLRFTGADGQATVPVPVPAGADRLVVSDHGWAAFVAPLGPWPAVHVVSPSGGVWPVSNVDLVHVPGRRPDGFVPPPVREGDLAFGPSGLVWTLPDGGLMRVPIPELSGAAP